MTQVPTRDRILDAALDLFCTKGYEGTTVREIEKEAGLAPGRGALYRHFSSKSEVLRRIVEREVEKGHSFHELRERTIAGSLGDARAELILQCRTALLGLEQMQPLIGLLARGAIQWLDPDRDQLLQGLVDASLEASADVLAARVDRGEVEPLDDPDAVAQVVQSALVGYHLTRQFFGASPGEIDPDRFARSLADLVMGTRGSDRTGSG